MLFADIWVSIGVYLNFSQSLQNVVSGWLIVLCSTTATGDGDGNIVEIKRCRVAEHQQLQNGWSRQHDTAAFIFEYGEQFLERECNDSLQRLLHVNWPRLIQTFACISTGNAKEEQHHDQQRRAIAEQHGPDVPSHS